MPVQQTNSSFAKKLGSRLVQAIQEHKDKPIDTGTRRLPAGIKQGIAQLKFMYTKEQTEDGGMVPKGESFFRASAMVLGEMVNGVLVDNHKGEIIKGLTTQQIIPLCDIPAKSYDNGYTKEAVSLSQNLYHFQNIFKLLSNGSIVCPETVTYDKQGNIISNSDPTGQKSEAFFFAAMAALTNHKNPIYLEFSTSGFTPKTTLKNPKPDEIVKETWHGIAQLPPNVNGQLAHNPGAGMTETPTAPSSPQTSAPHPMDPPPPTNSIVSHPQPVQTEPLGATKEQEVAEFVAIAMADPDITTPESSEASGQLEQMAWTNGWTTQQTKEADNWAQVGQMALTLPTATSARPAQSTPPTDPMPGKRYMYAKRTKEGVKYMDNKGVEFPPQECEVVTVNLTQKTVTLKAVHDGKPIVDLRSKQPVDVKFDWLEAAPPY